MYSTEPAFADPYNLIRLAKGMPRLLAELVEATAPSYEWGPARMSGNWPLIYLVFVISRIPDVEPWYQRVINDLELWQACGFSQVPSYNTVYLRFVELEAAPAAFEQFAARLMQKAKAKDARVGSWLHVDGSEAETHAAPQHDCQLGEDCATDTSKRLSKVSIKTASETRREVARRPVDNENDPVHVEGLETEAVSGKYYDPVRNVARFRSGGHWWRSRGREAGTRAYTRGKTIVKAWHGYLHIAVIDHFTHAPIVSTVVPATQQEHAAYPELLRQAISNLGGQVPLAVAADKGYSIESVFRLNTDLGIGSLLPYRRRNGSEPRKRRATKSHDEYGIPRCVHCGGDTVFIRFAVQRGKGRIWFRCSIGPKLACRKDQSIQCSEDYRSLLPIWRTESAYAAMRETNFSYEHKHRDLRIQYLVAPDCLAIRPKRPGRACQQLRASASTLIEWLRVTLRMATPAKLGTGRPAKGNGMVERLHEIRASRSLSRVPAAAKAPP